jgi:hypothetical protein
MFPEQSVVPRSLEEILINVIKRRYTPYRKVLGSAVACNACAKSAT